MTGSIRETIVQNETPGVRKTPVVARRKHVTDRDVIERFQPLMKRRHEGETAVAANRSEQAVKHWKAGKRCPDSVSLLNLAREFPDVWAMVCDLVGRGPIIEHHSPQMNALYGMMEALASQPGPLGAAIQAALAKAEVPA